MIMKKELAEQMPVLLQLSNEKLRETVIELSKLMNFEAPVWSVGISKKTYLISALLRLERATELLSLKENKQKTSELLKIVETQNPGRFDVIKKNIKNFLVVCNLKHRKN